MSPSSCELIHLHCCQLSTATSPTPGSAALETTRRLLEIDSDWRNCNFAGACCFAPACFSLSLLSLFFLQLSLIPYYIIISSVELENEDAEARKEQSCRIRFRSQPILVPTYRKGIFFFFDLFPVRFCEIFVLDEKVFHLIHVPPVFGVLC